MNCVNCGAPPKVGADSCSYCETALDRLVPEADHDEFETILASLVGVADTYRVDILERFDGPFTAGQVRRILAMFDSDTYRVDAAEILVRVTTNPSGLLASADLFQSSSYRADFVECLPRVKVSPRRPAAPTPVQPTQTTQVIVVPAWVVHKAALVISLLVLAALAYDIFLRTR